jgi:hypothetical protein
MQNTKYKLDIGQQRTICRTTNLCEGDLYVWWRLFQQFITASMEQFVANTLDNLELQNSTLEVVWLSIKIYVSEFPRDCNKQKMAKEPKWPRGRWIWITNTCLLQGNRCNGAIGESKPSYST